MGPYQLEHFVYSKLVSRDESAGISASFRVVGMSPALAKQEDRLFEIPKRYSPKLRDSHRIAEFKEAFGCFSLPREFLGERHTVVARFVKSKSVESILRPHFFIESHFVFVPKELVEKLQGRFMPIFKVIKTPRRPDRVKVLKPIPFPLGLEWDPVPEANSQHFQVAALVSEASCPVLDGQTLAADQACHFIDNVLALFPEQLRPEIAYITDFDPGYHAEEANPYQLVFSLGSEGAPLTAIPEPQRGGGIAFLRWAKANGYDGSQPLPDIAVGARSLADFGDRLVFNLLMQGEENESFQAFEKRISWVMADYDLYLTQAQIVEMLHHLKKEGARSEVYLSLWKKLLARFDNVKAEVERFLSVDAARDLIEKLQLEEACKLIRAIFQLVNERRLNLNYGKLIFNQVSTDVAGLPNRELLGLFSAILNQDDLSLFKTFAWWRHFRFQDLSDGLQPETQEKLIQEFGQTLHCAHQIAHQAQLNLDGDRLVGSFREMAHLDWVLYCIQHVFEAPAYAAFDRTFWTWYHEQASRVLKEPEDQPLFVETWRFFLNHWERLGTRPDSIDLLDEVFTILIGQQANIDDEETHQQVVLTHFIRCIQQAAKGPMTERDRLLKLWSQQVAYCFPRISSDGFKAMGITVDMPAQLALSALLPNLVNPGFLLHFLNFNHPDASTGLASLRLWINVLAYMVRQDPLPESEGNLNQFLVGLAATLLDALLEEPEIAGEYLAEIDRTLQAFANYGEEWRERLFRGASNLAHPHNLDLVIRLLLYYFHQPRPLGFKLTISDSLFNDVRRRLFNENNTVLALFLCHPTIWGNEARVVETMAWLYRNPLASRGDHVFAALMNYLILHGRVAEAFSLPWFYNGRAKVLHDWLSLEASDFLAKNAKAVSLVFAGLSGNHPLPFKLIGQAHDKLGSPPFLILALSHAEPTLETARMLQKGLAQPGGLHDPVIKVAQRLLWKISRKVIGLTAHAELLNAADIFTDINFKLLSKTKAQSLREKSCSILYEILEQFYRHENCADPGPYGEVLSWVARYGEYKSSLTRAYLKGTLFSKPEQPAPLLFIHLDLPKLKEKVLAWDGKFEIRTEEDVPTAVAFIKALCFKAAEKEDPFLLRKIESYLAISLSRLFEMGSADYCPLHYFVDLYRVMSRRDWSVQLLKIHLAELPRDQNPEFYRDIAKRLDKMNERKLAIAVRSPHG